MTAEFGRVGPKPVVSGKRAVASSQSPIVTETMLNVLRDGGNAVDAAIAGCIVQATVQQDMTNHTGTVTFLFWEAATGKTYQLNSMGTIVPELPPCRPIPPGTGMYASLGFTPFAVIPGFMPGMKALYERFGSRPWDSLVAPAIKWASEGHVVNSFEHLVMAQTVDFYLYTESGRAHFTPNGHLPQVGDRWPRPVLARTMERLAEEGPDYFIEGEWADHFVERAHQVGWKIEKQHMNANPPRWQEPLRFHHKGFEIVQLAPPERQALYCALVLGILDHFDLQALGHWSKSADALYLMAHALRRANFETGYSNDPVIFEDPTEVLLSADYHKLLADILRLSKSKVDLTNHVKLNSGPNAMLAAGIRLPKEEQPAGSCELTIVDEDGNWVQMMNTLQSGGIPGEVVDGVCMVGSHAVNNLLSPIAGWWAEGARMRSVIGNTIVLKDGAPWISLGSPGNVHCTVPQVLANLIDYGMDPYDAIDAPRMVPMTDDYVVGIESRLADGVAADLAKMGVLVKPHPTYDYHMGTFQMAWRDPITGLLSTTCGPRRAGQAGGY